MFNAKIAGWSLFSEDILALRVMHVSSKYPLQTPARYKNPQEVCGAFSNLRIGILRPPGGMHMDDGGEWGTEI